MCVRMCVSAVSSSIELAWYLCCSHGYSVVRPGFRMDSHDHAHTYTHTHTHTHTLTYTHTHSHTHTHTHTYTHTHIHMHIHTHTHTHTHIPQFSVAQYRDAVVRGDTATIELLLKQEKVDVDTPLKVNLHVIRLCNRPFTIMM